MLPSLRIQYLKDLFWRGRTKALLLVLVFCFFSFSSAGWALVATEESVEADQIRKSLLDIATKLKLKKSEVSFALDVPGVGLVSHRSNELMIPASTMKVVVAAAALDLLGPDFSLMTDLVADGAVEDGVLQGNLRIVGRGDPAIVGREDTEDVLWELRPWIGLIKDQGISSIAGKILADVRYFSGPGFHTDWPSGSAQQWYYAPSGALNLNDNCLDLIVGPVSGDRVQLEMRPFQPLASIVNRLKPVSDSKKHLIRMDRKGMSWEVVVSGSFLAKSGPQKFHVSVPDPASNFIGAFSQILSESGLTITGGEYSDSVESRVLARISHTLKSRLPVLLKNSQNLYADSIFRIIGKEKGHKGDFLTAGKVIREWSGDRFPNSEPLVFRDGSGLSRKNRLTTAFLQQLMKWSLECDWGDQLFGSLAVSGVDGTLKKRLKSNSVRGKILAKTGTLTGVSSLTGLLQGEGSGEMMTFAFICNRKQGSASVARQWQDRALELLSKRFSGN